MIELDTAAVRDIEAGRGVRDALWDRVEEVLSLPSAGGLQRVSVPIGEEVDPLDFVRAQDARYAGGEVADDARAALAGSEIEAPDGLPEAVYWSGRSSEWSAAGYGTADVVFETELPVDYSRLRRRLERRLVRPEAGSSSPTGGTNGQSANGHAANGGPDGSSGDGAADAPSVTPGARAASPGMGIRYYGGLRFDAGQEPADGRPDDRWAAFGAYRFAAPRFEVVSGPDGCRLACTVAPERDADRAAALRSAIEALILPKRLGAQSLPRPLSREDVPGPDDWRAMISRALSAFDTDHLDKVVLARRVALTLQEDLDPWLALQHLRRETDASFHFGTRPAGGPAFIGASPERLFRRDGRRVRSEAVAGTRSRGDSAEADEALRTALLESEKDRREHAFVEAAIREALDDVCTETSAPEEATAMTLARGRHLHTRVEGILRPDVTTIELLAALHPTPAVGGVPRSRALATIRSDEPFDRGWYAGPVGWIGRNAAEFAVGIRSGLAAERKLALFSGAGIVPGSEPEQEWAEIEQKIGDFAAVLDFDDPS